MRRPSVSLVITALFLVPATAAAQGTILPRPCLPQRPCPRPMPPIVERTASHVRVMLQDRVLRYEVEERFVNRGGFVAEADYVFPLPKNAAFEDLKLSINGELVSGETMGADKARGIYEEIVRRQRDPALVEWMEHGMLRARIFPIQPGEEKRVVVRFQSVAAREGDALRVDYRRGSDAGPRHFMRVLPATDGRNDGRDDRGDSERRGERESFSLTIPANAGFGTPYSPTHRLTRRERNGRLTLEAEGSTREVTILLPMRSASRPAVSLLAHSDGREERFALVTLTPPARSGPGTPRDVTFIIDVSGSMSGRKLEQAKAAGRQLLASLSPRDRFRLIDFSTDVRTFRDAPAQATAENIRAAEAYVGALQAQGSTNIAGALDEALSLPASDERLTLVLLLTDGAPTVGDTDPATIAARAAAKRGRARIFTFGVGADLNAALLERLALEAGGTASFVRPSEDVERAVAIVASRLGDPLVTDLRVSAEGVRLSRMHPSGAVDLFAGEDVVLLTRYDGDGSATLRFTGRTVSGPVTWTERVVFPERERGNPFVPRLWATQRLGWLAAEKRRSGVSRELDDEIRALGERYAIPTEFTSYLVLEPGMTAEGVVGGRDETLRRMAPQGSVRLRGTTAGGAATPPSAAVRDFESAKTASAQRSTRTLAAAESLEEFASDASGAGSSVRPRRVGNRVFALVDSVWTDVRHDASRRTVRIKAYSEAWFVLAAELPGGADAFALGARVIVDGRAVAIEVGDSGAETLSATEVAAIRREW